MTTDIVKDTWERLGHEVQALGHQVWVRCDPHNRKTASGLVWLAPKAQSFLGILPHLVTIEATVLSTGDLGVAKQFKPGDRVFFKRLHFGTWDTLKQDDREAQFGDIRIGFIDSNEILGLSVPDEAKAA